MDTPSRLAALRDRLPELKIPDFRLLPHYGWGGDSDVYLADGRLIVSFPRSEDVAASLDVQARLLPEIAERVPVAVPSLQHLEREAEAGLPAFAVYPSIPGDPLRGPTVRRLEVDSPAAFSQIARDLGGFLAGLHALPVERAIAAGLDPPRGTIRQGVERQRAVVRDRLASALEADEARALDRLFEAYLDDPAHFAWEPVVCHGDLTSDHLLAEGSSPARLSGVIDFADLCVGDPAGELTWRAEYGDAFFWQVMARYQPAGDRDAFARAVDFRWRLIPTVEIAFGLETGVAEYVAEGRRELRERLVGW